ncbi:DUF2165 family protein [Variovorax sp. M-6]|uniref:DUF2165 family protein n=1 Tax=Variovorax sp. M-6 TaxID=3233041 RepID=UPI003F9B27FC
MSIRTIAFSRLAILGGLALWMSIAVLNNLLDPGTNRFHVGNTLSMHLLRDDPVLGLGLRWRAWSVDWSTTVLYAVAIFQIVISLLLWRAAFAYARAWQRDDRTLLDAARNRAVAALVFFLLLWFGFTCGGLWFGYWMKQGAIQSVHMTLILIGLASLILVHMEPEPSTAAERPAQATHN